MQKEWQTATKSKKKLAKQISKSFPVQELRRAESPARDRIGPAATPAGWGRRGQQEDTTRQQPAAGGRRRLAVGRLVQRAPLLPHHCRPAAPDQRAPLLHCSPDAPDQGGGGLPAGPAAGVGSHGRGPQGCRLQAGGSQLIGNISVVDPDPDPAFRIRIQGFNDKQLKKNTAKIFLIIAIYSTLGLHKGRPSSGEACSPQERTSSTSKNEIN